MPRALQYLQYVAYGIGIPLQLMVIAAMLHGAYKRFPFLFAYVVAVFLATASEVPAYIAYFAGAKRARFGVYWINEGILTVLAFCVVIGLLYEATATASNRGLIRRILVSGAVIFPALSLALHYNASGKVGEWMTLVSRDLNFCAAILDLTLWFLLIGFRRKDHTLLVLSGALGIQFTGEAVGQSLRQLSRATVWPGNFIIVISSLVCFYAWWQTFRRAPELKPARRPPG
jgi:hypothetical protein